MSLERIEDYEIKIREEDNTMILCKNDGDEKEEREDGDELVIKDSEQLFNRSNV